ADIQATDEDDRTPLHLASAGGHFDVTKHLLDKGANVDTTDDEDRTPLHLASAGGHLNVANHLLDEGADIDVVDKAHKFDDVT
ncbi:hypothetical protein LEN26_005185, partial [Aphanomyces euteiches]